jgi:hypothetical protein
MNKILFGVCAALLLTAGACRSTPAPAGFGESWLLSGVLSVLAEYPDTGIESLSRNFDEKISAADYGQYVVITRNLDAYEGGAHGLAQVYFTVFDRTAAKVLALADVVPAARQPALKNAVEAALRARYNVPEGQGFSAAGFFSDAIDLTENFFLSDGAIGFYWNPYEIAPYVMGGIEVVVPFSR